LANLLSTRGDPPHPLARSYANRLRKPPPSYGSAGAEANARLREGSGERLAAPTCSQPPGPPPPAGIGRVERATPGGLTFFTSKRFLPAPLLVPLGVSTSIAAAILDA